jgi:GDPmannose 4,6-dehydratase
LAKTALITGVTGQDGAYLAKLLLNKGYRVIGGLRRSSNTAMPRLEALGVTKEIEFVDLDLIEMTNILRVLNKVQPDEIYNLAAQSFVGLSFEQPIYTANIDAIGPLRLLEAIRQAMPEARFYQASTSEMFGKVQVTPQDERTPFYPRSPYGVAKLFAHWTVINYRESYGIGASSGILFNHESPLRGREFVTRKITRSLALIRYGQLAVLELGNLNAERDWGFAGDYVEGMWLMLQQKEAQDFVIATGEMHSVRTFVEIAAHHLGFDIEWSGNGPEEIGRDRKSGKTIVQVNPAFYRPAEVDQLLGNSKRAEEVLEWRRKIGFEELVTMMVEADEKSVRDRRHVGDP